MIDFTVIDQDLEKTQDLPILTPDVLLEEALKRERAARMEIVEILRENAQQAKEIARLRLRHREELLAQSHRSAPTMDRQVTVEERLFEVCGALKEALSKVLSECESRCLPLYCTSGAIRALEQSSDELETVLSAPGFAPAKVARVDTFRQSLADACKAAGPTSRLHPAMMNKTFAAGHRNHLASVSRLKVDWS